MNREFEAVAGRFVDAWNAHDMAALGRLFAEDAEFVNVYGAWWTGRPQIEAEHAKPHATIFSRSVVAAVELRSKSLSPDTGHLHMRWTLTGLVAPDGRRLPDRTGVMILVLKRAEGRWLIAAAQNTDISSPPGPSAAPGGSAAP